MTTGRLLCLGEVLVEMVAEKRGQDPSSAGAWIGPYPSGAPAILADQSALVGADVTMVGTVGDDAFGDVCRTRLADSGVTVDHVLVDPSHTTGVAFVSYRDDGSRSFIFHVSEAAAGHFTDALGDVDIASMDCVHLMGSTAFSDAAVDAMGLAASAAVAAGVAVSFDPNIRPEMLTNDRHRQALADILLQADYVLASEGELAALLPEGDEQSRVNRLLAGQAQVVVLKKGAAGCSVHLTDGTLEDIPPIDVDEVDPTGAGDCFGGTFLGCVLRGMDPIRAAQHASIAGAMAVTQRGPMSGNRTLEALRAEAASRGIALDSSPLG